MRRLYRILLKIYPAGFREEYGSELERQFNDEYREAGGRIERIRFGLRAVADVVTTAPGETVREWLQDLKYAIRIYRKRSVGTLLAVAALAFAIGATTGIFSVLNALLIRALPFGEADRLVELTENPMYMLAQRYGSARDGAAAWLKESQYLDDAAIVAPQPMNATSERKAYRVTVSETSANFLKLLGVEPQLGRNFMPGEDTRGKSRVAVIGHSFWEQAFGGATSAIGSTIKLNGEMLTIIGVAPADFDFPEKADVWTPTAYDKLPGSYFLPRTIGLLKPNVTFEQAVALHRSEVDRIYGGKPVEYVQPKLIRLQDQLAGPVREASLALMATIVFVLLIACANLAHLLLSRTSERRHELAVRAALGASRARLTRQLITEAMALTVVAAVAGLAVALWTARLAQIAQPAQLAARQYTVLDWRVLAFALGLAAVTGILFGVLPAVVIGRMQPGPDVVRMQPGSRGSIAKLMCSGLIAVQVALTIALAAGSYSMGRSFLNLLGADLGYRTSSALTLSVALPNSKTGRTAEITREALERLRAIPGVESAGATAYLPLVDSRIQEGSFFTLNPGDLRRSARLMTVSPDYFRAMGTEVVAGREFSDADGNGAEPVVIVNEKFAQAFPDQTLIGKKLMLQPGKVSATIVGVVRSHRFLGPEHESWDVIYRPLYQYEQRFATFVVKIGGNPEQFLNASRSAIAGVDPDVPVYDVKTFDQRLVDRLARPRFYTTAIVFLTVFALLLAAIGAYGTASHSVAQRTHEIGVRIAVGAPPSRVRGMVFRQSMAPVCLGGAAGVLAAAGLSRFLHHMLASAESTGLWISVGSALAIAFATACAIWAATRPVIRTDPTAVLRAE